MRAEAERVPDELTCALGLDEQATAEPRATLQRLTASVNGAAPS